MASDDPRLSDEATGLPPLHVLDESNALLVLAWDASHGMAAGMVDVAGGDGTVAVRWLHLRGLVVGAEGRTGNPDWAQMHIAVPVSSALDVAAALAKGTTTELGDEVPG